MVGNNATGVEKQLDGIREKRHKFVCLNDNMNHSDPNVGLVQKALHDFYESMYPLLSSYELPADKPNEYLHMDEILEAREREELLKQSEEKEKKRETKARQKPTKEPEKFASKPSKKPTNQAVTTAPAIKLDLLSQTESSPMFYIFFGVVVVLIICVMCQSVLSCTRAPNKSREKRFLKLLNA